MIKKTKLQSFFKNFKAYKCYYIAEENRSLPTFQTISLCSVSLKPGSQIYRRTMDSGQHDITKEYFQDVLEMVRDLLCNLGNLGICYVSKCHVLEGVQMVLYKIICLGISALQTSASCLQMPIPHQIFSKTKLLPLFCTQFWSMILTGSTSVIKQCFLISQGMLLCFFMRFFLEFLQQNVI